jgi:hypothetical protein
MLLVPARVQLEYNFGGNRGKTAARMIVSVKGIFME